MDVYDNAKSHSKTPDEKKPKFKRKQHIEESERKVMELFKEVRSILGKFQVVPIISGDRRRAKEIGCSQREALRSSECHIE